MLILLSLSLCNATADSLGPMCLFSDEEGLGQILAKKEVSCLQGGALHNLIRWSSLSSLFSGWGCPTEVYHSLFSNSLCQRETIAAIPEESLGDWTCQVRSPGITAYHL